MDVSELLERVGRNLSVERAFGTPIEKDGSLVIPVALVAGGGGGGGGTAPTSDDENDGGEHHDHEPASGSGGGFGGLVLPVGAYVVKDDKVRWVPAVNANLVIIAALATLRLLVRARRRSRRRA